TPVLTWLIEDVGEHPRSRDTSGAADRRVAIFGRDRGEIVGWAKAASAASGRAHLLFYLTVKIEVSPSKITRLIKNGGQHFVGQIGAKDVEGGLEVSGGNLNLVT